MFSSLPPTPFDIRFRLFGFPVVVQFWFWLGSAVLGEFSYSMFGGQGLVIWVLCVFFSILVHELGHALLMRFYGDPMASITLTLFGGYASPTRKPRNRWKSVAISLAGPFAGFFLLAVVYTTNLTFVWAATNKYTLMIYFFLYFMNLYWGILNLIPVWPLDGGQAMKELCFISKKFNNPELVAHTISFVVALGIIILGVMHMTDNLPRDMTWLYYIVPGRFMMMWLAMLAMQNYQLMQQAKSLQRNWDPNSPW